MVGPTDGIADLAKFLDFYKLTVADLKPHMREMRIKIGEMEMIKW